MSNVNSLISQINSLTGYKIPSSSVVYTSGALTFGTASEYPNAVIYVPAQAPYGTISTQGIYPGAIIKSEQVLRIINALNGVNENLIIMSGSLETSGSNVFNGSVALPFISEGDFLFVTGGLVRGTNNVATASFVVSSSYSVSSSHALLSDNAITASYALFSEYGTGVIGATATLDQTTPSTVWNFNHRLGVQYPVITIYDNATNSVIIPNAIIPLDANNTQITFASPRSGHAVAVVGGGYFATTSGSTRELTQTVAATTWSFNHGLGTEYPVFQVYNTNNDVIYPASIKTLDLFNAEITFNTPTAGTAVAMVGGITENSAATASYAFSASVAVLASTASYFSGSISNAIFAMSASYATTASFALNVSTPNAITIGAITAEVTTNPTSFFLIRSGSTNLFNINSSGDITSSGSLVLETSGSYNTLLSIKNNGTEYIKVNGEGVLVLTPQSTPPTAVSGGLYFDTTGNFYIGL